MNCCIDCFSRESVRAVTRQYGEKDIGETCDYCGGIEGPFLPPHILGDMFRRVVDGKYVPVDQLSNARHIDAFDEGEELGALIDDEFQVFSDAVLEKREQLLADWCAARSGDRSQWR